MKQLHGVRVVFFGCQCATKASLTHEWWLYKESAMPATAQKSPPYVVEARVTGVRFRPAPPRSSRLPGYMLPTATVRGQEHKPNNGNDRRCNRRDGIMTDETKEFASIEMRDTDHGHTFRNRRELPRPQICGDRRRPNRYHGALPSAADDDGGCAARPPTIIMWMRRSLM